MSDSLNNKRIAKNTIYLYLRLIVSLCINLYISRAILAALGVEDYGIYNLVGGFVALLGIISSTFTSAAQRFITYDLGKGDKLRLKKTFSTFINIMIVLAIVVFIVGELLGFFFFDKFLTIPPERMNAAYLVFHFSLLTFIVSLLTVPYTSDVIAHECMDFYALVSIADPLLKLSSVLLLGLFSIDKLSLYGFFLVIVSIMILITYVIYCNRKFEESKYTFVFDKTILKEIASYSFWVTIGASSSILKDQGVNILINRYCGVLMNAARGLSMQVFTAVTRFSSSLGSAIIPQITKSYSSGDVNRSIRLTFFLAKAQGILLFLLSLPLLLETEYILKLWLVNVPDYAVAFTQASVIMCIARTFNASLDPLVLATGRVKWVQLLGGGLLLLNLPLSYLLLKFGGNPVDTMTIATIIELVVMTLVAFMLKSYVGFPSFPFLIKVILLTVICGVASFFVSYLTKSLLDEGFLRLIVVTVVSTISTLALSYTFVLTRSEREFLKNRLLAIKIKFHK